MEENEQYRIDNEKIKKLEVNMITIILTDRNKARVHEMVRELLRLNALSELDAEELMAYCEVL